MNSQIGIFLIAALKLTMFLYPSGKAEEYPDIETLGLVQQEFIEEHNNDATPNFLMKRARLGVSGEIREDVYVELIGGALEPPNNAPALVNAFADFRVHSLFKIRAGQFVVPFGHEGPQLIFQNPAIERSRAFRTTNTYNMVRDVGFNISGKSSLWGYEAAWLNGSGANLSDGLEATDFMGRLFLKPIENLKIGASGNYSESRLPAKTETLRYGGDFSWEPGDFLLHGEYFHRTDENGSEEHSVNSAFLLAGYTLAEDFQPIVRGEFSEGETIGQDDLDFYSVMPGFNWYYADPSRLAINYDIREGQDNLLTLQMQYVF